jgi:hypothetical protein
MHCNPADGAKEEKRGKDIGMAPYSRPTNTNFKYHFNVIIFL